MTKYKPLIYILGILLISLLLFQCNAHRKIEKTEKKPPNLILILVDDLGYADVGFNGCQDIPTPQIDRIAKEGAIFTNAYVSYAVCGPSRAGLITGRYQDRFGFGRNPLFAPNDPNMGLPSSEETLAEVLQQANYNSIAIGKWHLGAHPSQRPLKRGFKHFFGFLTGGHHYFPEYWTLADEYEVKKQYDAYRTKLLRDDQRIEESSYLTDALSREAVEYIRQYKNQPFFIYLAYNAPHSPLQATEKYLNRFSHIKDEKRKTYAAMVSAVDEGVGLILEELEKSNIEDNTVVVFLSDNGGPENRNSSDNGLLRGQKGDLTEGGIRVPFAMKWSKKIQAGTVYNEVISSLDIFATIVAANQGKVKVKKALDGVDLIPFLQGKIKGPPHEQLFWRKYDQKAFAIRSGGDKLLRINEDTELYNLHKDISETTNLSEEQTGKTEKLKKAYSQWENEMSAPLFLGLRQNKAYNKLHPDRFKRMPSN